MDDRQWRSPWSVTRILNAQWPMPAAIPASALLRGTLVHAWTEQYEAGAAPTPESQPEIAGYCEAYKRFCYQFSPSWEHTEFEVDDQRYHGRIDRVGHLAKHTQRVVADIKTGPPRKVEGDTTRDALQLAGYAQLLQPTAFQRLTRVGIYLRADGTWRATVYADDTDHLRWRQLVEQITGDTYGRDTEHCAPSQRHRDRNGPGD